MPKSIREKQKQTNRNQLEYISRNERKQLIRRGENRSFSFQVLALFIKLHALLGIIFQLCAFALSHWLLRVVRYTVSSRQNT